MKRIIFLVTFGCFLPGFIPGPASAVDSGARFSSISREVEVFPDANPDSRVFANPKTVLNADDHVTTGEESNAVITFADLSTLMLKAESEIVIDVPPDKTSKVDLLKGRLWLNVKKVVSGQPIEVKTSLATTGIKGTIVTFLSKPDHSEDLIQILRGSAEVTVTKTQEKTLLEAGQELLIKSSGITDKRSIDVDQESNNWKNELSGMGSAIELKDIPEAIAQLIDLQSRQFKTLKNTSATLSGSADPKAAEFLKEAGRFSSALFENTMILDNFEIKVNQGLAAPGTDKVQRVSLGNLKKTIEEARKASRTYLQEITTMIKRFAAPGTLDTVEQARQQMALIWSEVDQFRQELEGSAQSLSQDWFEITRQQVSLRAAELQQLGQSLQAMQEKKPGDDEIRAAIKLGENYETAIQRFLRDLYVPVIDAEILLRMQEYADLMSFEIGNLKSDVAAYPIVTANAQLEDRLRGSLNLVKRFSAVRRIFLSAQRLNATLQRNASSHRYRTLEQEQITELFQRVQDQFQELENLYEDIRAATASLEDQLGPLLRSNR
ncbi:MAG: FecR family protein [Candidatus Ozemobacteraceae bacterium]